MGKGIGQGGIDQFQRRTKTILRGIPYPALMSERNRAHLADGPIAIVGILDLVDYRATGIFEAEVMADRACKTGNKVGHARIFIGESGAISSNDEISARTKQGICREGELDTLGEAPAGNIR